MARKIDPAHVEWMRDQLRDAFASGEVRCTVLTSYTRSARRCRLLIPMMLEGRGLEIWDATYAAAMVCGLSMNDRGILFSGGGYSAACDLVHHVGRAIGCDPYELRYDEVGC